MIASLILLTLCQTPTAAPQGPSIKDFFPLVAGTKWQYLATSEGPNTNITMVVGPAEKVGDDQAIPIVTRIMGRDVDKIYYYAKDSTVFIVAYNPKKPFPSARPVLQIGEGGNARWDYRGDEDGFPLSVNCESNLKGKRKVLGQDVDILELKVDAVLGSDSVGMKFKQTALYARGIGLVEMTEERKVNKNTYKKHLTLTGVEAPAGAGGQ